MSIFVTEETVVVIPSLGHNEVKRLQDSGGRFNKGIAYDLQPGTQVAVTDGVIYIDGKRKPRSVKEVVGDGKR